MLDKIDKKTFFIVHFDSWKRKYYFDSFHKQGESLKDFDERVYELGLQKLNVGLQKIKELEK